MTISQRVKEATRIAALLRLRAKGFSVDLRDGFAAVPPAECWRIFTFARWINRAAKP